jgi:hypothetical protein
MRVSIPELTLRLSLGVLAVTLTIVSILVLADRFDSAAIADDAAGDQLIADGPRTVGEFSDWVGSAQAQDSDAAVEQCLLGNHNFVLGSADDAQLSIGDRVPDGVAEALTRDHRALEDYEIRTLIHPRGHLALSSLDSVSLSDLPSALGPSDRYYSAGYVELIYVRGDDGPAWQALEAAVVGACPER